MALVKPKNIRLEMRCHIVGSRFPMATRGKVETILVRAVRYVRVIRKSRKICHKPLQSQDSLMKARKRGRQDEALLRAYVFAALFRAWMIGFDEYPKINNKGSAASPFVIFAETVLQRLGIGKVEDHLEEFRSYRKKLFVASGFRVIRGKVI